MRVTHITELTIPMASTTKTRTITGETRRDWVTPAGIRARESFIPATRPDYTEWVRGLGITEITHLYHPDAKPEADRITARNGVPPTPSFIDHLIGRDVWAAD
jgi:hypothetical protein